MTYRPLELTRRRSLFAYVVLVSMIAVTIGMAIPRLEWNALWIGAALFAVVIGVVSVIRFNYALGLLILLLFVPFSFSLGPVRRITLADMSVIVTLVSWLWQRQKGARTLSFSFNRLHIFLILYTASTFISALAARDRTLGMIGVVQTVEMLLIYFMIISFSRDDDPKRVFNTITWALTFGSIALGFFAAFQFLTLGRAYPPGPILVGTFFLLWNYRTLTKNLKAHLVWFALVLLTIAVVFSLSRGLWGAFGVGSASIALLNWMGRKKGKFSSSATSVSIVRLFITLLIVIASVTKALPSELQQTLTERARSVLDFVIHGDIDTRTTWTIGIRFLQWQAAWGTFQSSPLIGVGPKNFFNVAGSKYVLENRYSVTVLSPHNQFLLTLSERGLIGLSLLMLIIIGTFARLRVAMSSLQDKYWNVVAVGLGGALAAICASGITSEFAYGNEGKFFFLILGLCGMLNHIGNTNSKLGKARLTVKAF